MICMQTCFFFNEHVMNWHGLLISHHDNTTIEVRCLWSIVGLIQQWSTQTWVMYFAIYLTQYMTGQMMSQEIGIGYLYIFMFDEQITFKTLVCLWGCFRQSSRGISESQRCHLSNDFWWTWSIFSQMDPWMVYLLTWIVVVFFNGECRYQRYISRGVLLILLGGWFSPSKGH